MDRADRSLPITSGTLYHVAFVVSDIDEAIDAWSNDHGAGPFFVARDFPFDNARLDGAGVKPRAALAFGYSGRVLIELIQPLDAGPSPWSGRSGLHHVAFLSDDVSASVRSAERVGYRCRFRADFAGGSLAYCRREATTGDDFIEYVQRSEGVDALLATIYQASLDWDGSDPSRDLGF